MQRWKVVLQSGLELRISATIQSHARLLSTKSTVLQMGKILLWTSI